ncbi:MULTISPECIES: glycoside hydrolase family 2 protein [Micromonospora]|uniref:beta-mannosidase n=1 Tax=Micromonospora solifontis TaxID=2487138 RepID=A0ABX9WJL2_9ACTN|nr:MULTISPECIES: glycoside hydrolase family 2 protein [Micromonospora]NES14083.1 glycoside hydrolase family 2 protein [Micromonospora sp. PPF5-17B]NES35713.1 glycoside hydrolase family 2 protein [Micromonospora solifontis]NES56040.1 glycoside hydrolase family 2 protein [Micromonospora sp. PPF5-6]RNM00390.1 glycoside hydrolase family 2 protein [Micromonospora solifontis]
MTRQTLHDGWVLRAVPGPQVPPEIADQAVPATVPGCVHTDLLAAGLIPDPYLDDNENRLGWIGRTDWVYETTFAWQPGDDDRVDLVCAGLDTVATVILNGADIGRTENQHRGYRFAVGSLLRPGDNTLAVRFDSPYRYAEAHRERLGDRPNAYPEPFNFIRKTACNFGWDWGPTVVTAGVWQEIGLHAWSTARLASVRPLVTVADGTGRVELHVEVERVTDAPLTVHATVAGAAVEVTVPAGERTAVASLTVADPELWWPVGYGAQPLHDLAVTLRTGDGRALDGWSRRIGFRSVRLDTTPDAHGTPFVLHVNDVPVFVKGVNWIPDDAFPNRVTRQRLAERFAQALGANVNLLRIWGGGRYESDDFYQLADERGLLVQQDFLFACAAYPEEEPFRTEVEAEAREQVSRLASHPSLVLWTGNNENIWGWHDWDWQEPLAGRTWGRGYYLELLPAIVAELDPTRPYWPGSPWSGSEEIHPNDPAHGTMHIWDVWNTDDYTKYREYLPRFVAEFGYQAPPAYATLRRALSDEPLAHDSPGMAHHQKAIDGDRKLQRGLDAHLPAPADFDDWHYLTQLNQARAIQLGVEHFRAHRPVCAGTIVWQLNDCWPVTSWAAVDGDGRRKPLWYALRRAYADRLLTVQPRDGGLAVVAVNETGSAWQAPATVTRLTLAGEPRAKTSVDLDVPAYSSVVLALPAELARPDDARRELLVAEAGDSAERALWFFAEDREIDWPAAELDASVEPAGDGQRVRVTARTVLRDLTLYPDRLDPAAQVDQALVTLLPGESATFTVHADAPLDPVALTRRPVLRCVNDITGGTA